MVHWTGNCTTKMLKEDLEFQAQLLDTMFCTLNNKSRYPTFEEIAKTLGTLYISQLFKIIAGTP